MKGTITPRKTYAAALEQPGAHVFWALSAFHNHLVIGANASNAYVEAKTPIAQFYVHVDNRYCQ